MKIIFNIISFGLLVACGGDGSDSSGTGTGTGTGTESKSLTGLWELTFEGNETEIVGDSQYSYPYKSKQLVIVKVSSGESTFEACDQDTWDEINDSEVSYKNNVFSAKYDYFTDSTDTQKSELNLTFDDEGKFQEGTYDFSIKESNGELTYTDIATVSAIKVSSEAKFSEINSAYLTLNTLNINGQAKIQSSETFGINCYSYVESDGEPYSIYLKSPDSKDNKSIALELWEDSYSCENSEECFSGNLTYDSEPYYMSAESSAITFTSSKFSGTLESSDGDINFDVGVDF